MKITLFTNKTGLIHGDDPRHIHCEKPGVLEIGKVSVNISSDEGELFPNLFNGESLEHLATYTTEDGVEYNLGKIIIRRGWIGKPSDTQLELMDLRCRAETAEAERDAMRAEIEELKNIFDTNSLNFLIK